MGWDATTEYELEGKTLTVGSTFKCFGERGKTYSFIRTVTNPDTGSTWIDCYGGSRDRQGSRAITPDTINPASIKPPPRKG